MCTVYQFVIDVNQDSEMQFFSLPYYVFDNPVIQQACVLLSGVIKTSDEAEK